MLKIDRRAWLALWAQGRRRQRGHAAPPALPPIWTEPVRSLALAPVASWLAILVPGANRDEALALQSLPPVGTNGQVWIFGMNHSEPSAVQALPPTTTHN